MDEPRRVMDIMLPPGGYPRLARDMSLSMAWRSMTDYYIKLDDPPPSEERLALVYDEDECLAGVLTQKAIIMTITPAVRESVGRVLSGLMEEGGGFFSYLINPNLKVSDVMTPVDQVAVKSTDIIYKEMPLLVKNNMSAFPVVNIWGKVIGMLRSGDVLHSLGLNSAFCRLGISGCNWDHYGVFDK
ncbi:MAG: HPP family protein [Bacillota bacterium]